MNHTAKTYIFSQEQEKKIFNLILKRTLDKTINWKDGIAMYRGKAKNNTLLFYQGDNISVCIFNQKEYAFFLINKEQAKILDNIIKGKFKNQIDFDSDKIANDFYECPIDVQEPVNYLEQI